MAAVLFPWKSEYSVNAADIDGQHQRLIGLINQLWDAMRTGQGKAHLSRILDELIQYTQTHFSCEEELMRNSRYPALAAHTAEHKRLTAEVRRLREDFRSNKLTITHDVMMFLKNWLNDHILRMDQEYAAYLRKAR